MKIDDDKDLLALVYVVGVFGTASILLVLGGCMFWALATHGSLLW